MSDGSKKYKIFFPIHMNKDWLGGVNYYKNLFHAISLIPDNPIDIFIPVGNPDVLYQYAKPLVINRKKDFKYKFAKFMANISGKKFDKEQYFLKQFSYFDFVSHVYEQVADVPTLSWIPDFQHKRLPDFFSQEEIEIRNNQFKLLAEASNVVILSSHAAQKDFEKYYPKQVNKTRVLNFVSYINPEIYRQTDDIKSDIKSKFNLPDKYFYLPNQFWQHKNHITVLKAVKELKNKGTDIHIVCSGNTEDYRNKNYFNDVILKYIKDNNLENNVHILGIIDLKEVYYLMRNCISVINPSLFEGWSSTVEEIKSLGKNIILSDLDVHKEQNPPCATYFSRENYIELSKILVEKWNNSPTQQDIELEHQAKSQLDTRMQDFGKAYLNIIKELDKNISNMSNS